MSPPVRETAKVSLENDRPKMASVRPRPPRCHARLGLLGIRLVELRHAPCPQLREVEAVVRPSQAVGREDPGPPARRLAEGGVGRGRQPDGWSACCRRSATTRHRTGRSGSARRRARSMPSRPGSALPGGAVVGGHEGRGERPAGHAPDPPGCRAAATPARPLPRYCGAAPGSTSHGPSPPDTIARAPPSTGATAPNDSGTEGWSCQLPPPSIVRRTSPHRSIQRHQPARRERSTRS